MKKAIIGIAIALLLFVLAGKVITPHSYINTESARRQAVALIDKAGGPIQICNEADNIFKQFGTKEMIAFSDSDLTNYPGISSLGKVDGLWSEEKQIEPAHIQVRAGNGYNRYRIEIYDTNYPDVSVRASNGEMINPRIFIHSYSGKK